MARTLGFLGSLVLIKSYLTTMTSRLFENFTSMHSFYGECFSFNDKSIQSLYQCLYSMIHLFLNKHLIEKNVFFFVLSRAWDKEKILSPYEGSNLRPSDSALRCSTTRVLHTARIRNVDSVMFVDRNKRYGMYWARPSRPWDKEKIDALPLNNSTNEFSFKLFSIVLGYIYIYIYIICLNKKSGRALERGIRRSEVRFLMGTQNFFFVPRSWQYEKK